MAKCATIPIELYSIRKRLGAKRSQIKAARFGDCEFLSPSFRCLRCCSHEEVMNQRVLCCSSLLPDQRWISKRHGESEVGHKSERVSERGGNSILASEQASKSIQMTATFPCSTYTSLSDRFTHPCRFPCGGGEVGSTYISQGVPKEVVFLIMLLQSCKFHSLLTAHTAADRPRA